MRVITTVRGVREATSAIRRCGRRIGFVPTMGALHAGHLSLMRRARRENDVLIVSVFVNPIQFGPREDFNRYPRPFARDAALCRGAAVDILFHPTTRQMYPEGAPATRIHVSGISDILCGRFRPGHFDGVATVVAKLFAAVVPDVAYFGEKDYQQLVIVRRMTEDLNLGVRIVACPTVREPDGLAMSSRNAYLSPRERAAAPAIHRALALTARELHGTRTPVRVCIAEGLRSLQEGLRGVQYTVEYFTVMDETLRPIAADSPPPRGIRLRVLTAVRLSSARLIDNIGVHTHP